VGFYEQRVLPRVIDRACGPGTTGPRRERVCAGLHGDVVELGFGSGHNVPYYPPAVSSVAAVEPSDTAWLLARSRVDGASVPVRRSGVDGQRLPLDDASFDCALSSWTLCTIPDATAALAEVRRVLRPGGTLHFIEHGLAPDEPVRRWQHRLEPVQKRLFGGCHLTRSITGLIRGAGFTITALDEFYAPGFPKATNATFLGTAAAAG
jgi:ubiquinone/menaquinone biosynthesis C-methylase UbiE